MAARAKKNFCQSDLLTPCSRHSSPSACSVEIWSTLTYTEFDCVALLAMLLIFLDVAFVCLSVVVFVILISLKYLIPFKLL